MTDTTKLFHLMRFFIILLFCPAVSADFDNNKLKDIKLSPGFKIEIFAAPVPGARSLSLGNNGTVFVGTRSAGRVYAVIDNNKDYTADKIIAIAKDLNNPNGVAFRKGDLYVAEISRILKYKNIENNLNAAAVPVVINDTFPKEGHHGWKFISFGPDGKLYVPVGAPCNICLSKDKMYASIMRMNPDGSGLEIFANGVRNTVGFDWNPDTGELWFTDNGRDWLGNDQPPDELNRAPLKGLHFGYPYIHGDSVKDPDFGRDISNERFEKPAKELGAHVAALGMRFYTGKMFPEKYRKQIFIAEHGSWNRVPPAGYRIMLAELINNKVVSYKPFAEGWLRGFNAWGRPVDVLNMPDGSIIISDDRADVLYRITYSKGMKL
ncbi:MAG: sorbosone dehydrogenase family protein [Spirochaetota bacterium]